MKWHLHRDFRDLCRWSDGLNDQLKETRVRFDLLNEQWTMIVRLLCCYTKNRSKEDEEAKRGEKPKKQTSQTVQRRKKGRNRSQRHIWRVSCQDNPQCIRCLLSPIRRNSFVQSRNYRCWQRTADSRVLLWWKSLNGLDSNVMVDVVVAAAAAAVVVAADDDDNRIEMSVVWWEAKEHSSYCRNDDASSMLRRKTINYRLDTHWGSWWTRAERRVLTMMAVRVDRESMLDDVQMNRLLLRRCWVTFALKDRHGSTRRTVTGHLRLLLLISPMSIVFGDLSFFDFRLRVWIPSFFNVIGRLT